MAHKKGLGSSRNGRDSNAKRLGVKVFAGQTVTGGEIIVRQRGTVQAGRRRRHRQDDTIFARPPGTVEFSEGRRGRVISVAPAAPPSSRPQSLGSSPSRGLRHSARLVVGRIRISLMSTCGGCDTANITARATSSASSALIFSGLSKNGVSTMPGSISVTRTPVSLQLLARGLAHRGDRALGRASRASPAASGGRRPSSVSSRWPLVSLQRRACVGADRQRARRRRWSAPCPPVLRVLLEEAARGAEAGVGEHDVDPPELVERALHERLLVLPLGDVAADGERRRSRSAQRLRACPRSGRRARRR